MRKVFGIGWAKTGTTTLGECLRILGFNHQTQNFDLVKDLSEGDLTRIFSIAEKKDSFEDWPWLLLFKEFDERFPGSQFILTKRDPERWIKSYRNMLVTQGQAPADLTEIRTVLYGLPFPNVTDSQLIDRYEQHNDDVERYFRHRPDDLLVLDWENGDGWTELCTFLGMKIPDKPLPHANKGSYRVRRLVKSLARSLSAG